MTIKKYDVIAIGRACIDLNANEYNRPMEETMSFNKYVGGSPANIVIGASRLGLKTGFIGKVSDDQHGRYIKNYLADVGVDVSHVVTDQEGHKTGLTFTEIVSPEESNILMYREGVADLYLTSKEIDETYIKESKMIVISGTALSQSPSREAVLSALAIAKKNKVTVIFELDYRPYTWVNDEETAIYYSLVAEQADIVIGTRDEYNRMENVVKGTNEVTVAYLFQYSPELLVIKHGLHGSNAYTKSKGSYSISPYKSNVLKTFGAGDSYAAAFLYALNSSKSVKEALQYGSAAAAIVISKHSSSEAMPTVKEIEELIAEQA